MQAKKKSKYLLKCLAFRVISQLLIKIFEKFKSIEQAHDLFFPSGYVSISVMILYPAKITRNRGMSDTGT